MAQIERRLIKVAPLGGMDLRWEPPPNAASLIQDMTWDQRGGWINSGGFNIAIPIALGATGDQGTPASDPDPNPTFPASWPVVNPDGP